MKHTNTNPFCYVIWVAVTLFVLLAATRVSAGQRRWNATELFTESVTERLRLVRDGAGIELARGELVEDDGPAAGYSYQPNEERLSVEVWARKELIIPRPEADKATLLVARGGDLRVFVNGRPLPPQTPTKVGNYWQTYRLPVKMLRAGKNTIVLSGKEGGSAKLWIARDDEYAAGSRTRLRHPNRSAKSGDGGKTWDDKRLGVGGSDDGEYYVRVFLDHYLPQGKLTSPVVDSGNLDDRPVGPPVSKMGPVKITPHLSKPSSTGKISLRVRTGTTAAPDDTTWSKWQPLDHAGVINQPLGRYVQFEIELTAADPLASPRLMGVTVAASPRRPADWTKKLRMLETHNPRIIRSSIPFRYEPLDQPRLSKLREKYRLNEVVRGASNEFELIQRLAAWSATRWRKGHLREAYPAWDALAILDAHQDGTPVGGFCQQYNLVFLQACQSFGLIGRLVSIGPGNWTDRIRGGHEVAEIWSSEFGKWVYVDGNTGWYFVDQAEKTPLSLWELRQRQLAAFRSDPVQPAKPVDCLRVAKTRHEWKGLTSWPPFIELRLIPRSDFLDQQSPLPLNQGMRGWFWTGHHVWTDELAPARPLYSRRIAKRENFEWTLNQVHVTLEATDQPGRLRVHFDTNTPGFETFRVTVDDKKTQPTAGMLAWRLREGKNRLSVVAVNQRGRKGIPSSIVMQFHP